MPCTMTKEEIFQNVLIEQATGVETKDELREMCVAAGMFDDDPGMRKAKQRYQDRVIRDLARQRGWVDKDGQPLEVVNVIRPEAKTGKDVHYYIDLRLANFEDQRQLVSDRLAKANYFHSEAKRYYDDGCQKFGRKFQKLFNFAG